MQNNKVLTSLQTTTRPYKQLASNSLSLRSTLRQFKIILSLKDLKNGIIILSYFLQITVLTLRNRILWFNCVFLCPGFYYF